MARITKIEATKSFVKERKIRVAAIPEYQPNPKNSYLV